MIYFAFGSNMDPEQMRDRCPSHKVLGRAYLPNHDLCFPRRSPKRQCGTAGVEQAAGKGVWGVLYQLDEDDQASLHDAEGYAREGSADKNRHTLIEIDVRYDGPAGETVSAHIYLARSDGTGVAPSQDYLKHLIRGAEHHALPETYLRMLLSIRAS